MATRRPRAGPRHQPIPHLMKTVSLLVLLMAALVVVGCNSPASRIRRNPELFSQLTPSQQDLIRQGRVELGFSAEMVRLALGEPDRLGMRTDADGTSEIWNYVTYEAPDGIPLYRGWYHRYHAWGDPLYPYYTSFPERRERERFRVIFRRGTVHALEHEKDWRG